MATQSQAENNKGLYGRFLAFKVYRMINTMLAEEKEVTNTTLAEAIRSERTDPNSVNVDLLRDRIASITHQLATDGEIIRELRPNKNLNYYAITQVK